MKLNPGIFDVKASEVHLDEEGMTVRVWFPGGQMSITHEFAGRIAIHILPNVHTTTGIPMLTIEEWETHNPEHWRVFDLRRKKECPWWTPDELKDCR